MTVDASRQTLVELLELQSIDFKIDRLNNRLSSLPEQAELDQLQERYRALEKEVGDKQALLDEVSNRQRKLDAEIDGANQKIKLEEARLYAGDVTNPRELASLVAEVDSLKRRRSRIEDSDLEVMEEKENYEKELKAVSDELEALKAAIEDATERRNKASGDLNVQLDTQGAARTALSAKFDRELLALYDDLRASKGGVGAAALSDDTCLGCHIKLPAQEVARVRSTPGMAFCDECGRILVVTD
jgi:predicted  nucleic acid-binding Zn-ribbon protein